MKTIDAVNYLDGIWLHSANYLLYDGLKPHWYFNESARVRSFLGNYKLVCTREEFNQCVEDLSTNFGTSCSYDDYKINYKNSSLVGRLKRKPPYEQDQSRLPDIGERVNMQTFENLFAIGHIEFKNDIGFLFRYEENNLCDFCEYSEHVEFGIVDTRTDKEKAIDNIMFFGDQHQNAIGANLNIEAIKAGKIHGVKWVGE